MARQLAASTRREARPVLPAAARKSSTRRRQCRGWAPKSCRAMDVARSAMPRLVEQARAALRPHRHAGNNAGISAQALFADVKAQDLHWYEDLMKVNLWGAVWCTHAALPHLKAAAAASWRWSRSPAWSACRAAPPTAPPSSP
jgi:NAD(P)-dependent dehydrogenase (short-subunit alcohol dehydrogenase family)